MIAHFRLILIALAFLIRESPLRAQEPEIAPRPIEYREFGLLEAFPEREYRLGDVDRMFLVEDQWEWDRCARIIPKLPKIDVTKESLLIITTWETTPRTLESITTDNVTLRFSISHPPPPTIRSESTSPKFLTAKLPAWPGPVKFDVNGATQFTLLRGERLADYAYRTWESILYLHSGGRPSGALLRRYWKRQWPDMTDEQFMEKLKTSRAINPAPFYQMLFRELVDTRAREVVPRIFDLFDAMGDHDKAFDTAWKTVVAIGGPDVFGYCKEALNSPNRRSRRAAMLILKNLALPESRELAHRHLADDDSWMGLAAVNLLHAIGLTADDGPAIVLALEKFESRVRNPPPADPRSPYFSWDIVSSLIDALLSIDPSPDGAVPVLKRLAASGPTPKIQEEAQAAFEQLKPRE